MCVCVYVYVYTELDECLSGPCLNGNCTDILNGYTCSCSEGFTGLQCEIGNMIHYNPYRAFGGPNKIVYSTHFVTRRAIFF